jgi:hypothetical protein
VDVSVVVDVNFVPLGTGGIGESKRTSMDSDIMQDMEDLMGSIKLGGHIHTMEGPEVRQNHPENRRENQ